MTNSKVSIASFLLCLLLLNLTEAAHQTESTKAAASSTSAKIDCDAACAARCQLASRQRLCHRACGTCCARCSCVPPGTSGNRDVCPCYATMTTHGGRLKCP